MLRNMYIQHISGFNGIENQKIELFLGIGSNDRSETVHEVSSVSLFLKFIDLYSVYIIVGNNL